MTQKLSPSLKVVLAVTLLVAPSIALAQESRSAAVAAEVVGLLDAGMLDGVAAPLGEGNAWVGALYFPGTQLLVVSAEYAAPARFEFLLEQQNYRDIYLDLNGAAVPGTRTFISDLGANGLQFDRARDEPFDTVDTGTATYAFDGDWGQADLSRDEYTEIYQTTDEQYTRMLEALLAQLKRSS